MFKGKSQWTGINYGQDVGANWIKYILKELKLDNDIKSKCFSSAGGLFTIQRYTGEPCSLNPSILLIQHLRNSSHFSWDSFNGWLGRGLINELIFWKRTLGLWEWLVIRLEKYELSALNCTLVGGHQGFEDFLFSFPALSFEILDWLINPWQYIWENNCVSKRSNRVMNICAWINKARD